MFARNLAWVSFAFVDAILANSISVISSKVAIV